MSRDRASWDDRTCAYFIELITEQKNQCHWAGNTLTPIGWQNVSRAFNESTQLGYTKKQLQNKYNDLKRALFRWRDRKVHTGLGPDRYAAATGKSSQNAGGRYKRPQCCEQLFTLLGHTPSDRGKLASAGGHQPSDSPNIGSPHTPEDHSDDPVPPPPACQSSKRLVREFSVTSPRKKSSRTPSIDDCLENIDGMINETRNRKALRTSDAEEMAQVNKILKEDGISESDIVFAKALNLCSNRIRRRAFLDLETKEGRQNWVAVTWEFVTSNFK